jgi:hypothetical protein
MTLKSWHGDWHARIYDRVRSKGFDSVTGFAEARPTAPTLALSAELGVEDVNAAQVVALLRDEAERDSSLERYRARCAGIGVAAAC